MHDMTWQVLWPTYTWPGLTFMVVGDVETGVDQRVNVRVLFKAL